MRGRSARVCSAVLSKHGKRVLDVVVCTASIVSKSKILIPSQQEPLWLVKGACGT